VRPKTDPEKLAALREAAESGRGTHYTPYSKFLVLAAVETLDGRFFGGANVEIVNFSLTKHAEEAAILAAIHAGALSLGKGWLRRLYVAGGAPCGSCRQFAVEFGEADSTCIYEAVSQDLLAAGSLISLGVTSRPSEMRFDEMLPDAFLPGAF